MLGIEINEEFLDLGENGCTIELNNPMFANAKIQGSGSFDWSIPATDRNNRIFGNINQVATTKRFVEIPCNIYLANQFWKTGNLVLDTTKLEDSYSARFDCDLPTSQALLQETMIDSFDYGSLSIGPGLYATFKTFGQPAIDPITTIVKIILDTHGTSGTDTYQTENGYFSGPTYIYYTALELAEIMCDFINAGVLATATFDSNALITVIPIYQEDALNWTFSIQSINYYNGNMPISVIYDCTLLTDMMNYNKRTVDISEKINEMMFVDFTPNQEVVFAQIYNPKFYDNNAEYLGFLNQYNGAGGGLYYNEFNETTNPLATQYSICPQIVLLSIIDKIKTMPDINFVGGFFDDPSILDDLYVYNNFALDKLLIMDYPTNSKQFNVWDEKIVIANHIPKINVIDTIKALAQAFGYVVFFNDNTITLISYDDIIESSEYIDDTYKALRIPTKTNEQYEGLAFKYADSDDEFAKQLDTSTYNYVGAVASFPLSPAYNDLCFITGEKVYYAYVGEVVLDGTMTEIRNGEWKAVGNNYKKAYNYGSAPYLEKQLLIPALTSEYFYDGDLGRAQISQAGSSYFFGQGIKKVNKLYLMKMSAVSVVPRMQKIDMNDLFTFHQNWADFQIKSYPISRKVNFNILDILNFDFTKKRRINDTEYIYKTVRFSVKGKSISPADVIMYPDLR